MKRWLVLLVIFLVVVCVGVLLFLYFFWGLREYMSARTALYALSTDQRMAAVQTFTGSDTPGVWYLGTYAGFTNFGGSAKIWMWSNKGLRSFDTDQYSVYSFFNACLPNILQQMGKTGDTVTVDRSITTNVGEWTNELRRGDYMGVKLTAQDAGGTVGVLREAFAESWWAFMPVDIRSQCARR